MENKNFYICVLCGYDAITTEDAKPVMRYRVHCTEDIEADSSSREAVERMLTSPDYQCQTFRDSDTGRIPVFAKETTFIDGKETLTAVYVPVNSSRMWLDVDVNS
jgi:hypothetical protein